MPWRRYNLKGFTPRCLGVRVVQVEISLNYLTCPEGNACSSSFLLELSI